MLKEPILSLIVPTRKRTDQLRTLLDSLRKNTRHPHQVEVVLVADADDEETLSFQFPWLGMKRVVAQPGLTMGGLNRAGVKAAAGQFLMLLNDDVLVQTKGWDRQVLSACGRFADGIVLVHVNDTLFGEGMCTFPIVSRTFCDLAGGICPTDYQRYRIDDHIENIFHLLAALEERRILYLPDVVFEHCKLSANGQKGYFLHRSIEALDGPRYVQMFGQRRQIAVRMKQYIEAFQGRTWQDDCRLEAVEESASPRTREIVRGPVLQRIRASFRRNGLRGLARSASKVLLGRR
ncbi:MAG TPA: glycosyltransferase family 2 protein [Gemmataceae bacterium]|nr:glycosyltransferase family 2 protein [Gemmataceae bacterium]